MLSLVYLVCFLDLLSLGILLPVAPVHLISIGASRFLIGGLTSLHALLQLSTGPLIGSWSDSKGRKKLLIQCLTLISVSNVLLLFTSSLPVYVISRVLFGLTGHVQILLRALVASKVPKEQQNAVFAKMGAAAGLSFVIGPLLGGFLNSTQDGFLKIAIVLNLLAAVNLGVSFFVTDSKSKSKSAKSHRSTLSELAHTFTNLSKIDWSTFWDLFLFRFLCESAYSAFFTTFGALFIDHFGATQGEMALTITLFSVTMIFMNLAMGKVNRTFYAGDSEGYRRNLHGFLGLLAAFGYLNFFAGYWAYVFTMIGMGVFRAILDMTWTEMLMGRTSETNKGTVTGSFESVIQMANLATPLLATYVGENHGYLRVFLIILTFLSAGCLTSVYRLNTKRKLKDK